MFATTAAALIFSTLLPTNPAPAETRSRVLLLPFTFNSEKNLSFLNRGITGMLTSRLADKAEVITLQPDEIALTGVPDETAALALARQTDADYVLLGSVTLFGGNVSTDALFLDVETAKILIPFNGFGENPGDVLAHVDRLATQIKARVFGGPPLQPLPSPPQIQSATPQPALETAPVQSGQSAAPAGPGQDTALIWKSRNFKVAVQGLSIGDLTGDGRNEIVMISDNRVFAYQLTDGVLVKLAEVEGSHYLSYIGVDAADINAKGPAEIFVTAVDHNGKLSSCGLEWNGAGLKPILEKAAWYFRVITGDQGNKRLVGQKQGLLGTGNEYELEPGADLFLGKIHELQWTTRDYAAAAPLDLPAWVNVFGFTVGDVLNKGQAMVLGFSDQDRLRLSNPDREVEWESDQRYGGTTRYLEYKDPTDPKNMERRYLPQRVFFTDLDRDGQNEIVVVKNRDLSGQYFSRFRAFKNGRIECLAWTRLAVKTKWQTDDVSGYISDYAIGDIDNDGREEVLFAVSTGTGITGALTGQKKSYLVTWHPGR